MQEATLEFKKAVLEMRVFEQNDEVLMKKKRPFDVRSVLASASSEWGIELNSFQKDFLKRLKSVTGFWLAMISWR
jgi:predicted hydrocarbon binding protein